MSYKDDINRIKNKKVIDGLPKDLEKAIQTFINQAISIFIICQDPGFQEQ